MSQLSIEHDNASDPFESAREYLGRVFRRHSRVFGRTVCRVICAVEDAMGERHLVVERPVFDCMTIDTVRLSDAGELVTEAGIEDEWAEAVKRTQAQAKKHQRELEFMAEATEFGIREGHLIAVRVTRSQIVTVRADESRVIEQRWIRRNGYAVGRNFGSLGDLRAMVLEYVGDREKVDIVAERKAAAQNGAKS